MVDETITLEFLGAQQRRILLEMSLIRDEMSLFRAQVNEVHDDIQFVSTKVMPQKGPQGHLKGRAAATGRSQVNDDNELRASLEQLRKLVYPGPTHVAHDA
jgi:hypothetical protein